MKRPLAVVAAVVALTVPLAACGDDDDATTTTTGANGGPSADAPIGGDVLPPEILTPENTSTTVSVGTVVTFDMGDPGEGSFVAVSEDPEVFRVDGEGSVDGSATFNAGGTAVAEGTTEVSVSFRGSENGMGTPTVFTITVE